MNNLNTQQQAQRVEELLRRFDEADDERVKAGAAELVQALMDIHGAGLARMVDLLSEEETGGTAILKKLAADQTVAGLLILYGLHPVSLSERVRAVIAELQPMLESQHAKVETISIEAGHLHLRLSVKAGGCHSGGEELKAVVEDAIIGAAPDLASLKMEILTAAAAPVFVPLHGLKKRELSARESQSAIA
jgi:Fe-S cluster biogenesis protein NfuA